MKKLVKAQTNCILQKTKKTELIQYVTNNEEKNDKSRGSERKIKQKQRQNFKERNSPLVIIQLETAAERKALLKSGKRKDDLVLARFRSTN